MHYRQRWSKSSTVKCLLVPIAVPNYVTQQGFSKLDIVAEWTGFDHSRVVVFVTGLAQIGNAHQCSRPHGSTKPWVMLLLPGCGVDGTRPGEQGCYQLC